MDDQTHTLNVSTAVAPTGRTGQAGRAVEVLLTAHRTELNKLEQRITEQIQRLAQELARDDARPSGGQAEAVNLEQLAAEQARIEQLRTQLEEARNEHQQTAEKLAGMRDELAREQANLARDRERLDFERKQLEEQRLRQAERETETKCQRRRIAKALEAQKAAQQAAITRRQAEVERVQSADKCELHEQLTAATEEADTLRKQTAQLRKLLNARADELNLLRDQVRDLTGQIERLEAQHDKLSQELAVNDSHSNSGRDQIDRLRRERDELLRELEALKANQNSAAASEAQQKCDDLQRRFELALEDLREMKRRNADLEAQIAAGISKTFVTPSPRAAGLDWESQKKRLLAALEADHEPRNAEQEQERLTIEGTIRITDDVVADKDREIAELRSRLASAPEPRPDPDVVATEMLNGDDIVRQEREKLAALEAEWREKLRKAEIDISVERAKIARDRAEIEEKLQTLQSQQARTSSQAREGVGSERPTRRWLSRLGLKDLDE